MRSLHVNGIDLHWREDGDPEGPYVGDELGPVDEAAEPRQTWFRVPARRSLRVRTPVRLRDSLTAGSAQSL